MTLVQLKAAIDVRLKEMKEYQGSEKKALLWVLDLIDTTERYEDEDRAKDKHSLINL
jgi:hypothetical protein